MRTQLVFLATLVSVGLGASQVTAQPPRDDVFWARNASGPLVLDGILDEASWAQAESMVVNFGEIAGIPGSGWKVEAGAYFPTDSTKAVAKLLVSGNQLYLGLRVKDVSVGGSEEFNRFDGILMALKDHADPGFPKPPAEYLYSWWYPDSLADPQPTGQLPGFIGRWGNFPPLAPRTPEQVANWDAVTVVQGLSNDDSVLDEGYTIEMRFNLTPMGYDVTQPGGDVVEWNLCIYDSDFFWPFAAATFTTNRVWWQSPWGNAAWYNEVKVHARPDVTVNSGALPIVDPELRVQELLYPAPVIDGALSESQWSNPLVQNFDIRWDDAALRAGYPGMGPYRSGQFQAPVNGGLASVLDPGDATVKMFFTDDILYLGFDVRDQVVQYHSDINRRDGFWVTINDRSVLSPDNTLQARRLSFVVGPTGVAVPGDYLTTMVTNGDAEVAISLNPGTTVDTLGTSADAGYTAELALDLTALGYPSGLGDGALFISINLLDGDSFTPYTDSYGTRTWWFREFEGQCCPAWVYLDQISATGVGDLVNPGLPSRILGVYPNPAVRPRIQYRLEEDSRVTIEIMDVQGRKVESYSLGVQPAGIREINYDGSSLSGGIYFYRLKLIDPEGTRVNAVLQGKMLLLH